MRLFRTVAFLEGLSFVVLLGIAMPMKYVYGQPQMVSIVGMVHGLLFIAYLGALGWISSEQNWPLRKTAFGVAASVLPFGPFVFDWRYSN